MKVDDLFEARTPKRKRVVRKGKVVRKKKCQPGYRLVDGKCVRQKPQERIARRRGARKANRKSKTARRRTQRRSNRVRARRNL